MESLLWNFSIRYTMNYMFVQIFVKLIHVHPNLHSQVIVMEIQLMGPGARRGAIFAGLFFYADTKNSPSPSDLDQTQNIQPRTWALSIKWYWKYRGAIIYRVWPGWWLCPLLGPQTTCDPGSGGYTGSAPRQHIMTCDVAPGDYHHCVISPSVWEI